METPKLIWGDVGPLPRTWLCFMMLVNLATVGLRIIRSNVITLPGIRTRFVGEDIDGSPKTLPQVIQILGIAVDERCRVHSIHRMT